MIEKNFEYLKDQLLYTGFGDTLNKELSEKMTENNKEFKLTYQSMYGQDLAVSTLNFRRSENSEMFFFNRFDVELKRENQPNIKQSFYMDKGNHFSLKEAYNLMSGRAVYKDLTNKDNEKYQAWVTLDFNETDKSGNFKLKQYHQNYGYNLNDVLSKHAIKELSNPDDLKKLMASLEKGNRQAATITKDGAEQRVFIEANPQFKSLTMFDSNMTRLYIRAESDKSMKNGHSNEVKQSSDTKKEQQQSMSESDGPPTDKKEKRAKGIKIN